MNLLAHAWLSFKEPEILVGNMISDYVKGKKRFDFDASIQKGIMLHRYIDTFTDEHAATKEAKQYFKPAVGLYAGAFVDVAYDHFLALDENEFTQQSLQQFSLFAYSTLNKYESLLPEKFARMLPYMQKDNWLYNYRTLHGIEQSFGGLARRAKYINDSAEVFIAFNTNYDALKQCFNAFFPDVKKFAHEQLDNYKGS